MRLNIQTKGFRLKLWLPTWLILNRLTLSIVLRVLHSRVVLAPEARSQLLHQCRTLRKVCRGVPLVEVHTAGGEDILVRL